MEREILKAALAPGPDCVPLEQLGRYADGALATDERITAAAHIRACHNCQAELALLQAVTTRSVQPGEADTVRDGVARLERRAPDIVGVKRGRESSSSHWIAYLTPRRAALVAFVLLIGVVGRFSFHSPDAPELPASVTGDDVTRSQRVSVRGPAGDLLEAPRRFDWIAVDRASRYRARLMEVDRREVWSVSTEATGVELPPEVRALSVPSKTLLWDVTAYDASGAAIAGSGPQAFRLVPR